MPKWLLADGNNALLRATFAMQSNRSSLSSVEGVPTGALLVFINTLSRHIKEESPTHAVVAWDDGRSTYRTDIFPGYKAARASKPEHEEVEGPFGLAKEFLTLANIPHVQRQNVEADDLIAAYVHLGRKDNDVVIISSDKDFLQLLGPTVDQVRLGSANTPTDRWTRTRVIHEYGLPPYDLPLVMALDGDASDGVPGIPGIGPKTAIKIVQDGQGDLAKIFALKHKKVEGHRAEVFRNLRLVDLTKPMPWCEVESPPPFRPTSPGGLLWPDLLQFLERYQLQSVKKRLLEGSLWASLDGPVRRGKKLEVM